MPTEKKNKKSQTDETKSVNLSGVMQAPIATISDVPLTALGTYAAKKGLEKFAEEFVLNHQAGSMLLSLGIGFLANKAVKFGIGAVATAVRNRREQREQEEAAAA